MTSLNRRELLRNATISTGCAALAPFLVNMRAMASGDPHQSPKRFVFVTRSNGLLPYGIQPQGLEGRVNGPSNAIVRNKDLAALDLADYELHETMSALSPVKQKVNVIQGLSAKMCGGNHSAHYGAMGAYTMRDGDAPKAATIDSTLAKAFPGIFPHVGLTLAAQGRQVLNPVLSASGPGRPISYYADPALAYQDLFGAAAIGEGNAAARSELDTKLLDFMVSDINRLNARLPASEREKLGLYLEGFESLRDRRVKIASVVEHIRDRVPDMTDKYTSEVEVHRLEAHFDLAAAALVTGLTNVVAINTEDLGMRYNGLGLGEHTVHHIGHLEVKGNTGAGDDGSRTADEGISEGRHARDTIRRFHMELIGGLASKLDAIPEGDGTMLDNTLIVFFAHSGDRHHPNFFSWPIVTVGGLGGSIRTGQYVQYPSHGERGHHTIGNFYTTIMHAAGLPQDGFGQRDIQLGDEIDQECPLSDLLT